MLASTESTTEIDAPNGGDITVAKTSLDSVSPDNLTGIKSSNDPSGALEDDYLRLQGRIYRLTLIVSLLSLVISLVFFSFQSSLSLSLGAVSGILYLRLLSKGIEKIGKTTKTLGKTQLAVPVLLVLVVSKLPSLHLLPALLGFILYKPSLIIQFLLESKSQEKN